MVIFSAEYVRSCCRNFWDKEKENKKAHEKSLCKKKKKAKVLQKFDSKIDFYI